jgi:hypothetical protein
MEKKLNNLLYNFALENNPQLSEDHVSYLRGILVAIVGLSPSYIAGLKRIYSHSPSNAYTVIMESLPENWRSDYRDIAGIF